MGGAHTAANGSVSYGVSRVSGSKRPNNPPGDGIKRKRPQVTNRVHPLSDVALFEPGNTSRDHRRFIVNSAQFLLLLLLLVAVISLPSLMRIQRSRERFQCSFNAVSMRFQCGFKAVSIKSIH